MSNDPRALDGGHQIKNRRIRLRTTFWLVMAVTLALAGCQTVPPFSPVNLQEPGWNVREGQAVYHAKAVGAEIAGQLLLATAGNDRVLVHFSKGPFPLVIAQSSNNTWQVELPVQNKRYSGRGRPPTRLIWLYLPGLLGGQPPPRGWVWHGDQENWRLEHPATGESLEGFFNP